MTAEVIAAWLVTFAVHGTVPLLLCWFGRPWLGRLPDRIHEALLRFALLAPLLSATLQVALVTEPVAGHLTTVTRVPAPPPPGPSPAFLQLFLSSLAVESLPAPSPVASIGPATIAPIPAGMAEAAPVSPWPWLVLAASLAAGAGILLGLRLRFGLWRILRRRRPVNGGPIATELNRLQRLAGLRRRVRLSTCESLQTPIAFGILRPEICLPTRAIEPEHRAGMLAHELAHIVRWDPLWLCTVGFLERVFCWQPLIRLVRLRLRELSEFRADAWAAQLTGGLPLARCLVVVADWVARNPRPVHLLPGMAQGRSNLRSRIDRLLEGRQPAGPSGIWTVPLLTGLLVAMTSALPGAALTQGPPTAEAPPPGDVEVHEPPAELLALLQQDRENLQVEVEALYNELPPVPDPELMALMQELHRRLESLDQRRMQLLDLLLARERNH